MMTRFAAAIALLAGACSSGPEDPPTPPAIDFPFDDSSGKDDVFGRSLIGVPNAYAVDVTLSEREAELNANMRLRREAAWETAFKVLEPVPLLGLADAMEARPDCAPEVAIDDLRQCARQRSEGDCGAVESGGVEICAWRDGTCDATCDMLRLADGEEIPTVPRFSSWYGVEDITRIFQTAYGGLTAQERLARTPLTDAQIGEALVDDHHAIDRSSRWPLERYTSAVNDLFACDLSQGEDESDADFADRCLLARQSAFSGGAHSGGGIARLVYSPAMVTHMLRNYAEVLDCRDDTLLDTWCGEDQPCADPADNFSRCYRAEFPVDGGNPFASLADETNRLGTLGELGGTVVIKATWARVGFGFELPVYDTDAETLTQKIEAGARAQWPDAGDRAIPAPESLDALTFPTPRDIYTIRTRSGSLYRLTGLHIMTKELRHWQWVSLWWSDDPDSDFGADRPASWDTLPEFWRNYKMCVVTDYLEADPDPASRFPELPSLQAALQATGQGGQPTWCSNPYIEQGAGNARTNCIGCHQHAGSRFAEASASAPFVLEDVIAREGSDLTAANRFPANGRTRRRTHFATDYSWAFSRLDDLTELLRTEVEFAGASDPQWARAQAILNAEGDVAAGEAVFRNTTDAQQCTSCHGDAGEGGIGPDLHQLFASKTAWHLLHTVINGRGRMPAWGEELTDQQLTDLFTYLTTTFGSP